MCTRVVAPRPNRREPVHCGGAGRNESPHRDRSPFCRGPLSRRRRRNLTQSDVGDDVGHPSAGLQRSCFRPRDRPARHGYRSGLPLDQGAELRGRQHRADRRDVVVRPGDPISRAVLDRGDHRPDCRHGLCSACRAHRDPAPVSRAASDGSRGNDRHRRACTGHRQCTPERGLFVSGLPRGEQLHLDKCRRFPGQRCPALHHRGGTCHGHLVGLVSQPDHHGTGGACVSRQPRPRSPFGDQPEERFDARVGNCWSHRDAGPHPRGRTGPLGFGTRPVGSRHAGAGTRGGCHCRTGLRAPGNDRWNRHRRPRIGDRVQFHQPTGRRRLRTLCCRPHHGVDHEQTTEARAGRVPHDVEGPNGSGTPSLPMVDPTHGQGLDSFCLRRRDSSATPHHRTVEEPPVCDDPCLRDFRVVPDHPHRLVRTPVPRSNGLCWPWRSDGGQPDIGDARTVRSPRIPILPRGPFTHFPSGVPPSSLQL